MAKVSTKKRSKKPTKKPVQKSAKKSAKKAAPAKSTRRSKSAPRSQAKSKATAQTPASAWVWHEVMTTDVSRARAFYGGLLGWSATEVPMASGPYTIFAKGDQQLAGCMAIPEAGGQPVCAPHWLSYVGVEDVDATVAKAASLGGSVEVPPMDIPGIGRFSVLRDPTGASFAVYRSATM